MRRPIETTRVIGQLVPVDGLGQIHTLNVPIGVRHVDSGYQRVVSCTANRAVTERHDGPTAATAGEAAVSKARPLSHNNYKVKLAAVAVKRALLVAAGQPVPNLHARQRGGAA